jgi:hypothetical protein
MSEESFLLCDGVGCAKTVPAAVAVSERWWQVRATQHDVDEPSTTVELDLCPDCFETHLGGRDKTEDE